MLASKVSASTARRAQKGRAGTRPAPDDGRDWPLEGQADSRSALPPGAQPSHHAQPQPASAAELAPSLSPSPSPPPPTPVSPPASAGPAPRAASGPRPTKAGLTGAGQVRGQAWAGAAYRAPGSSSTTLAAPGPLAPDTTDAAAAPGSRTRSRPPPTLPPGPPCPAGS